MNNDSLKILFSFFIRTPLHLACAKGHVNVVNFLTVNTQTSKLNLCDNDQRSALMKVNIEKQLLYLLSLIDLHVVQLYGTVVLPS